MKGGDQPRKAWIAPLTNNMPMADDTRQEEAEEGASRSNNNNTFTWSGPSGVLGCTGQRRSAPPYGGVQPSTKAM
jgi:hypothetical protein